MIRFPPTQTRSSDLVLLHHFSPLTHDFQNFRVCDYSKVTMACKPPPYPLSSTLSPTPSAPPYHSNSPPSYSFPLSSPSSFLLPPQRASTPLTRNLTHLPPSPFRPYTLPPPPTHSPLQSSQISPSLNSPCLYLPTFSLFFLHLLLLFNSLFLSSSCYNNLLQSH